MRSVDALGQLLSRLGRLQPTVLFVDDLQWGDADSALVLNELFDSPDSPRLLFIGCYRGEDLQGSPCLQTLLETPATSGAGADRRRITVQPLSPEESRLLAAAVVESGADSPRSRQVDVSRESRGNPFFLIELARQSPQEGAGVGEAARSLPVDLEGMLLHRVGRLPKAARELLNVIAVAGHPLRMDEACRAIRSTPDPRIAALLRSDHLIRTAGGGQSDDVETYHDRIRETISAHLSAEARRGYHARLAPALEASPEADPETLCVHFEAAGDNEKAGRYGLLAANRAADALAFDRAAQLYRFVLGLGTFDPADEPDLHRKLSDALANAAFIGFTGTPIEKYDANTRAVFGDYVSIYDIERAVRDKATVPIYYESRIARLSLNEEALPAVDDEFEEITEDEEEERREKIKTKWAALEALVGDENRITVIAKDLVEHFERRYEAMEGKAMVVGMSRRICVELYNEIVKLRPGWHDKDDEKGVLKIVMTGSASDDTDWQQHIRNKPRRKALARRFKDPKDPFRVVIVRDMWLTGFDAPCMHTMYLDKPMRGHGLMQAITRVNRVFRDKPGGLVVDYLGLADQLKYALATYTQSGDKGDPCVDTAEAISAMQEKYEICCGIMHGFDWSKWTSGTGADRLALLPAAMQHVLEQEDGKARFCGVVRDLSLAFALCAASDEATEIRDDIAFFQAVRAGLVKPVGSRKTDEQIDWAVKQLVSKAVSADGEVIDVFSAAGLKKPDISILSDEFLAEVQGLKHKNVAAELLKKLLKDEIKTQSKRNVVQARKFSEMLKRAVLAYQNRAIATHEIIEELLKLAREIRDSHQRGDEMGLPEDELAFYDALAQNESAMQAMGIDELKVIAAELVTNVRKSVSIDWTLRESARAKIRVMVRRILNKHGYPPDLRAEAVKLVLEQAETLCAEWAA